MSSPAAILGQDVPLLLSRDSLSQKTGEGTSSLCA